MDLFVIIVTYNGIKWLKHCLDSVENSTMKSKIVLIDNNSKDGTQDFIKNNYPEIIFFETGLNLGFGQANNIGINYAIKHGAKYSYLLNQDAWVEPQTFEIMFDIMERNKDYGILSPMQLTGSGKKLENTFFKALAEDLTPNILRDTVVGNEKEIYQTRFVMASHWMMRIEAIKNVGGFAPIFHLYGEDDNLVDRFIFHGYKIGITLKTKACHDIEFRPELSDLQYLKRRRVRFTHTFCDINVDVVKSLFINVGALWYYSFKYICKHPLYTIGNFIYPIFILKKAIRTRKTTKIKRASYIKGIQLEPLK